MKKEDLQQEKGLYQCGWLLFLMGVLIKIITSLLHVKWQMPPCIVYKWTGYYCPGCGGTRACLALLRGELWESFCFHPAVLYAAVLYIWFMVSHSIEYMSKGRVKIGMKYSDRYLYVALGIIFVQWILKNFCKAVWGIGI